MTTRARLVLAAGLVSCAVLGCERPGDGATNDNSAARPPAEALKEAARGLKDEAEAVGRDVARAGRELGAQATQAAQQVTAEAIRTWAVTRDEALRLSARVLDQTKETIAALRERAAGASESARPALEEAARELEAKAQAIAARAGELKNASAEAWEQAAPELAAAVANLAAAAAAFRDRGPRLSGTLTYRERMALPAGAEVRLKLVDVSRADAPAETMAETTFKVDRQPPIEFELAYDAAKIRADGVYALEASIAHEGRVLFRTKHRVPVLGKDAPARIEVMLQAGT